MHISVKIAAAYLALLTAAQAGAWLQPHGETAVSITHFTLSERNRLPRIGRDVARKRQGWETQIDYGWRENATLSATIYRENRHFDGGLETRQELEEIALTTRIRWAEYGLLPPYFYRLLKKLDRRDKLHRQRRTSLQLHLDRYDDGTRSRNGRGGQVSAADKLSYGRFIMIQEARYNLTRRAGTDWRDTSYRTQFGWNERFWLGYETGHFDGDNNPYREVRDYGFVEIANFLKSPIAIRWTRGKFRHSGNPDGGRYDALEFRVSF